MLDFKRVTEKQRRIVMFFAVMLLLAISFKMLTERLFLAQASIEGAFFSLDPEVCEGTVTMTGRYMPPPYGFSEEKLLMYFGEKIGLEAEGELREVNYDGRKELVYEKNAAQAHSLLKVVYLTEEDAYYLCAEITLTGENATSAAAFREMMQKTAEDAGLCEVETTVELCGIYNGEIPLAKKDELTDRLLGELYAQPVYENRENRNYTVYAYTGAVEEYIVVAKKKINVQVAIYYDRNADRTEVVLASPLGLR